MREEQCNHQVKCSTAVYEFKCVLDPAATVFYFRLRGSDNRYPGKHFFMWYYGCLQTFYHFRHVVWLKWKVCSMRRSFSLIILQWEHLIFLFYKGRLAGVLIIFSYIIQDKERWSQWASVCRHGGAHTVLKKRRCMTNTNRDIMSVVQRLTSLSPIQTPYTCL